MRKFCLYGLLIWGFAGVMAQGSHEIYLNEGVLNGHPLLIPSKNILVSGSDLSTGIQAISDNRITLWDYNTGTVIKNITVDAYQYPEYKLSPSERYLILKSEDSAKIFDLSTFEFVLTIPSESSFMPMGGVLPFPHFFNSDSFLVFSHNNKYYTAQVSNSKSIAEMKSEVTFDLSNIGYQYKFYNHVFVLDKTYEIIYIDVLTGKMIERFDKKKYYHSGWEFEPITAGKHLLCHRYNEGKSQLCLFDKESNTFGALHEINFFFSGNNVHELEKNKSWIVFSEASSKPGYPFAIVNIEHDTLQVKQFELHKGFSRMDANGANLRYNRHLLAITESKLGKDGSVLYTQNIDNGVRTKIEERQTVDWVEIIDTNLIMYSVYNDKDKESRYDIKLLNTTSGKVSALPAGSSPILKPVGAGKYNAIIKENKSYKLAVIKNGAIAESKPITSGIKKLHIALKGKINDELIFTVEDQSDNSLYSLFKLPDFNVIQYNNLIIIHASKGKVESNRYPEDIVKKALESEYNFICKWNDTLNWMGSYEIDSVSLIYINTAQVIYKNTYQNFRNSFPYPSPCKMDWIYALDTTQTAFIYKTYYEFGKFSIINGVLKKEYGIPIKYATVQIGFCNNAQHMYLIGNTECIVYETNTGKPIFNYKLDYLGMQLVFTQSSKFIVSHSSKKQITVLDFKDPLVKHVFEWENKKWIGNSMTVESSGNIFYTIERTGKLKVYSLKNAKLLNEINVGGNREVPALLISDSVLLYFHASGKPAVWNFYTNSMELYSSVAPHARVTSMYYWNETKQLVTTGFNSISVWNTDSKELLYQVLVGDTADFIVVDKDGFYSGAKTMFPKIRVRQGSNVIHPGQIDILYNRPDKITQTVSHAFGKVDTALVNSYYRAWQKRVSKLKVDTTLLNLTQPPPSCDILHKEDYAKASSYANDLLRLTFRGVDTTNILSNYNVWVNDVPIFGQRGKDIRSKNLNTIEADVTIILSQGENKIETSVMNINGIESYRVPLYVRYTPKQPITEKLYFIGIGIDKYREPGHNLQYSAKDIRDLAKNLKEQYKDNIVIDTLLDENVTVANIRKLKDRLLQSTVNDKVIVAFSGHGLLSRSYDYYLATYNVNFNKPEEGGLPYEDLEWLLDSIPARKKLMLIDACHSGELDKEEIVALNHAVDSLSTAMKGYKGVTIQNTAIHKTIGLKNSFELMQELFANVNRGTGATVIAASGGTQFAQEHGNLKNGVFTYSILELMQQKKNVRVSELKSTVGKRVEELTNGNQKPTSRNENIEFDWRVW